MTATAASFRPTTTASDLAAASPVEIEFLYQRRPGVVHVREPLLPTDALLGRADYMNASDRLRARTRCGSVLSFADVELTTVFEDHLLCEHCHAATPELEQHHLFEHNIVSV